MSGGELAQGMTGPVGFGPRKQEDGQLADGMTLRARANDNRGVLMRCSVTVSLSAMILCAAVSSPAWAQHPEPKTDGALIANAMSAAPPAISKDATVIAMEGDKIRTLRKGTNEFTCVPDDPGSPGNDPMCLDRTAMEWLQAWMDHKDAPKGKPGLVYMLQGGSDASNDDPFATTPPPGKKWVTTGPHVMVVGMAGMLGDLPRSADDPTKPFIMWGGSSYEHIMMPVK
jgi:hypothetical protein